MTLPDQCNCPVDAPVIRNAKCPVHGIPPEDLQRGREHLAAKGLLASDEEQHGR